MSGKSKKKISNNPEISVESYKNKIVTFLKAYNKKLMTVAELEKKCRTKKSGRNNFVQAFDELRTEGVVAMRKGMKVALTERLGMHT